MISQMTFGDWVEIGFALGLGYQAVNLGWLALLGLVKLMFS